MAIKLSLVVLSYSLLHCDQSPHIWFFQEQGAADILGLQAGVPDVPASLAAAAQPGLPSVATQRPTSPAVPLEVHLV